jgi:hypothetical protein
MLTCEKSYIVYVDGCQLWPLDSDVMIIRNAERVAALHHDGDLDGRRQLSRTTPSEPNR